MIESLGRLTHPLPDTMARPGCTHFSMLHHRDYLRDAGPVELHVLIHSDRQGHQALISDKDLRASHASLAAVCAANDLTPVDLDAPLPLETVAIPKPWGQEIWYTGIEARGVCRVNGMPLPWLLDIFGDRLGCSQVPLLLKILDPYPEENIGDLYFEMHQHKREVYVVTAVDETAWPDGTGGIRYGFNQSLRAAFPDRHSFLAAYLEAVNAYRNVRSRIDEKVGANAALNDYRRDLGQLPESLRREEVTLRNAMYEFTAMQPLKVGDVVTVEPLVPHSLQHGVRVVEFQTPHYERYILSFGQQVVTQDHWDTAAAMNEVVVEAPQNASPETLAPGQQLIADFDAFRVRRLQLEGSQAIRLRLPGYALVIGVYGRMALQGLARPVQVATEQAYLVPAHGGDTVFCSEDGSSACVLVAEEKPADS